ncbi:MAG: hypothetical protein JNL54_22205 [Kineosporiaceae bacterium]|nr:hypothetical protein [Kineosporiaceae bacterium]
MSGLGSVRAIERAIASVRAELAVAETTYEARRAGKRSSRTVPISAQAFVDELPTQATLEYRAPMPAVARWWRIEQRSGDAAPGAERRGRHLALEREERVTVLHPDALRSLPFSWHGGGDNKLELGFDESVRLRGAQDQHTDSTVRHRSAEFGSAPVTVTVTPERGFCTENDDTPASRHAASTSRSTVTPCRARSVSSMAAHASPSTATGAVGDTRT